jgi:hypothetical protein
VVVVDGFGRKRFGFPIPKLCFLDGEIVNKGIVVG